MQRRELIKTIGAAVGGVTVVGGGSFALSQLGAGSGDSQEEDEEDEEIQTVTDAPAEVDAAKPLIADFLHHISPYYESAHVYPYRNGLVVMEYQSDAESGKDLLKEFYRIAVEYIKVIENGDHTPRTLAIVVSEVQAVVPKPSIKAHLSGRINQEAFLQTIEVRSIERRTESE